MYKRSIICLTSYHIFNRRVGTRNISIRNIYVYVCVYIGKNIYERSVGVGMFMF